MQSDEFWNSDNSTTKGEEMFALDLRALPQLHHGLHGCTTFEAERRMLKEMLVDAIKCWQSVSAIGIVGGAGLTSLRERLYREASFWIFGDYDNTPFFSFTQICDCLGLNTDFVRRRLLEWRRSQQSAEGGPARVVPLRAGARNRPDTFDIVQGSKKLRPVL
jgi:hypothetical protein